MGASSWITTGAVAAALIGAGGYAMLTKDCDTCLISSIFGADEPAATTTVAAEAEPKSCCALGSKADAVMAAADAGEIVTVSADAAECEMACESEAACDSEAACEVACDETADACDGCDEPCTEACEEKQIAAKDAETTGDG